ncbi:MAG: hypothetical protein JWL75_617 [Parcubacteria group bacterium]|nr:hypothetical protein [Parcubacteria group bacterium]
MSQHHDSHSGGGGMDWLAEHMGGLIMGFGKKFEGFLEKIMFFVVNGGFQRVAIIYLVIFTPILLLEFLIHLVRL